MDRISTDARNLAGTNQAAAPRLVRNAVAPWLAELAALLVRGSAILFLLSPLLLAAALLLG